MHHEKVPDLNFHYNVSRNLSVKIWNTITNFWMIKFDIFDIFSPISSPFRKSKNRWNFIETHSTNDTFVDDIRSKSTYFSDFIKTQVDIKKLNDKINQKFRNYFIFRAITTTNNGIWCPLHFWKTRNLCYFKAMQSLITMTYHKILRDWTR